MAVSKDNGNPKWMVKIMVPSPIKMDDLGAFPLFLETSVYIPGCHGFGDGLFSEAMLVSERAFLSHSVSQIMISSFCSANQSSAP